MSSKLKKLFLTIILITLFTPLNASDTYFIDLSKVLNESKAGADFQNKLKRDIQNDTENFSKVENEIRKEESDLISKKKIISKEEYEKKVTLLREKVANLQADKQKSFSDVAKSRNEARKILIDSINPILKKYMEENNIRVVVDKQSVILADTKLEITNAIIDLLNKNLSSIKLN
jgi:outer membrane protein